MERLFNRCPSCESAEIRLQNLSEGGFREFCPTCNFVTYYVEFACKPAPHCNADVFGICPRANCPNPGVPRKKLCVH